jgi:hypothetical protein
VPESGTTPVLIGFKDGDTVLLDASDYCEWPGFRQFADPETTIRPARPGSYVQHTPDIVLPPRMKSMRWTLVTAGEAPTLWAPREPHQWLNAAYGFEGSHCLYVSGDSPGKSKPRTFDIAREPVIAHALPVPESDVRLVRQGDADEIEDNAIALWTDKYPWLRKYESGALYECDDKDTKPDGLHVIPVQARLRAGAPAETSWLVTTQCAEQTKPWALVTGSPDAAVLFVQLIRPRRVDSDYHPQAAWVVDVDGDGVDEILVHGAHPGGFSHVLLKLAKDGLSGVALDEIATTAYYNN